MIGKNIRKTGAAVRKARPASFIAGLAVGVVLAFGVQAGAANVSSDDPDAPLTIERFQASVTGLLMAISSLSVDTELNARKISELEGRLKKLEGK